MTSHRSFRLLVNPEAGGGGAQAAAEAVAALLRAAGARVEIIEPSGPEAIAGLAAAAVRAGDVVVSVGGDGMVATLAGPMAELCAQGGTLGIIPAGRGNDFARMLGVGRAPEVLAERLLRGEPRLVDVIECGDDVVAGSVYSGLDADAAAMVSRMRRTPKALQYPIAGVRAVARSASRPFRIRLDGELHELDAVMVVVANSQFYGKGMKVAPNADLEDGLLDVIVVDAAGRLELLVKLAHIYRGTHVTKRGVRTFRAREVELGVEGPRPVALGGDGEDLGCVPRSGETPIRIVVRPRALRVL